MNQSINQPVVNWAKQTLPNRVEVRPRYDSSFWKIFTIAGYSMLAVLFLAVPAGFFYGATMNFISKGWSEIVAQGLALGGFMLIVFGGLLGAIVFLPLKIRRTLIKFLDATGVETRGGIRYPWEKFSYLDYKKTHTLGRRNPDVRYTERMLFAGVRNVTIELVFENGKAVIPPLIDNQPEILRLLETMPAQRRDDGQIMQGRD